MCGPLHPHPPWAFMAYNGDTLPFIYTRVAQLLQANYNTDTEYSPLIEHYTHYAVKLFQKNKYSSLMTLMTFIGRPTVQLYCLLVGTHCECT